MLSTVGPRRALHHNLTAAAHAHTHTRSFIFLPFCGQLPRRRPPADAARLLLLLQRVTERRVVVRWEWAGAEAGWVRVQGGSGSSSVEYDIDLITLRRVPRRAEGVVEARAEVKEKAEKGAAAAGKKGEKEKEKAGVEPEEPGSKKEKEKAEKEREKAEKERKEKERAEKEKKEKDKAEKEKAEKEKAEKEKAEKEKAEKEKDKKEKEKEKEKEETEKAKEKEPKPPSKDSSSIDLPVKTTKANTSEILAKIIKDQTDELQKMAPPALPEKPTGRKEVTTPAAPEAATEAPAKPKSSQPASVAQSTKVGDLTKVAKETPAPSPTSIKTDTIKPSPTTGTIPATAVPKNQQAAVTPQVKKEPPKSHSVALGKVSNEAQESPDADIDLLRPSDIRAAAGIPAKADPKADTKKEKAKQPTTTTTAEADTSVPPPQKKPRESPEELRKRMRRIADSLDLGPIDKFIPSRDHHDRHDYEWSGTEDVSAEDVLKRPSPPAEPIQKPMPPPTSDPTPLIEPVVPTMPFTEPPTPPPQPPPTPTPKNYYILVRNPDTGSMHFTPLPHSLISDFPTLSSRESTAFDAMRRLTSPEAFLPLWRVLQRGGFEVVVEKLLEGRKAPRRKIFWSAVWVAACTGAVTVGLETYL
ncbi:hypothetical protein DFP73DRAFT_277013 [Morchella snyderi]|nr:hypothetical protein DFP73DRAFT_277013 [Morchella snyderi]